MKKLLLALLLCLFTIPALAQNVTCATRPSGDNSNACASTAFINGVTGVAAFYPVQNPSSGNWQGSGGPASPHQLLWSDANIQLSADSLQFYSTDPSAAGIYTFSGSCTAGDVITITWFYGLIPDPTVSYTVLTTNSGAACYNQLAGGIITAIQANPILFDNTPITCPRGYSPPCYKGGYDNNHFLGYVVPFGNGWANDWNTAYPQAVGGVPMLMKYTVAGAGTEVLNFPAGWFAGYQFTAGTSTGSANAQVIAAPGFANQLGDSVYFTPGFTNTGATQINVQGQGLLDVQKRSTTSYVPLAGGEIVAGTPTIIVLDENQSKWLIGSNSSWVSGGSTVNTLYRQPNALDNNPVYVLARNPPNTGGPAAPATDSAIYAQYALGPVTSNPYAVAGTYGVFAYFTSNAFTSSGAWVLQTQAGSWLFGGGIYTNIGCAGLFDPYTTGCFIDKGQGTINTSHLWLGATADGNGVDMVGSGTVLGVTATALNLTGTYEQSGVLGVTCTGIVAGTFTSRGGIVTHC